MIIAAAFGIWSVAFVQRRGGGLVLILLSLVLLLVGGGFAPPLIGLILESRPSGCIRSTP